jgi:hypothetical protein
MAFFIVTAVKTSNLALLGYIQEVLDSNLSWDTGCPLCVFLWWFFSLPPYPFQFFNNLSYYPSMLYGNFAASVVK